MRNISEITKYNIRDYTFDFIGKTNVPQMRDALEKVMEPKLVESLGDDMVKNLYENVEKIVEEEIRKTIFLEYGQKPLPVGSKIKLLRSFDVEGKTLAIGDIVTIDEAGRFDDDTFGYGWYYYIAEGAFLYMYDCEPVNMNDI